MKYVYKKVDYYSMQQLMDLIEQLKNEYQIIGYEAYAQEQYAVLTLYPKKEDFLCYDNKSGRICLNDDYVKALEKYCSNLESVLADTEYDLESSECQNRELTNKLEKIRGVLDEKY